MFISKNLAEQLWDDSFQAEIAIGGSGFFWISKRVFDIALSICLLPILFASGLALLIFNPFLNRGPMFYSQTRMGKDCLPFTAVKFRSMTAIGGIVRGADDPIEQHRITILGSIIRKIRIDELPQILNVLKGDMSLIGPRPDYFDHASEYYVTIPEYRLRHTVRPGISGLAQVRLGYAEGTKATRTKTSMDLEYIRNAGFGLDSKLVFETIRCVILRSGA